MSESGPPPGSEIAQSQIGFAIKDLYRIEKLERVESAYYVYCAVEIASSRQVLAYQVQPHLAQRKGYLERFQSDVRKLQRLRAHPAFPEVLDFCANAPDQCYLITAYPGVTDVPLSKQLERGLPLAKALHNLGLLCDALDTAHREGLVHYHLSPERILLSDNATGERTLHILGYGLLQQGSDALPAKSGVEYLAPEQLSNEPTDAKTDQFVLAAIAYEMISGRKAFAQRGDTPEQIRERIRREDPLPIPLSHARETSINNALNKAFSKARQQRHATVRELSVEFGLPLERQSQTVVSSKPSRQPSPWRWVWIITLGLLAILGAVLLGRLLYLTHGPGKANPDLGLPDAKLVAMPDMAMPADLSPEGDAAAAIDMIADLATARPKVPPRDLGSGRPPRDMSSGRPPRDMSNGRTPPPPPPPPEQYVFRYSPEVGAAKRAKLESCLRGFGNQFEIDLTLLGDKYRVSSATDSAFQKSNALRSCLDLAFKPGDLPDPLTIRREKRGH